MAAETGPSSLAESDLLVTSLRSPLPEEPLVESTIKDEDRSQTKQSPSYHVTAGGNETVKQPSTGSKNDMPYDDRSATPLHHAVRRGDEPAIILLLRKGADINGQDADGKTPMHWAAQSGNEAMVKLLIEKGAGVNNCDYSLKTPLHSAVESGTEAAVKVLIEKGANINCEDYHGKTPLQLAVKSANEVTARLLIEV
jgi:ankyrin repeat protein